MGFIGRPLERVFDSALPGLAELAPFRRVLSCYVEGHQQATVIDTGERLSRAGEGEEVRLSLQDAFRDKSRLDGCLRVRRALHPALHVIKYVDRAISPPDADGQPVAGCREIETGHRVVWLGWKDKFPDPPLHQRERRLRNRRDVC